jgi:(2S)-methylsuccinyl-CoA dehydrogenase
MEMVQDTFRSFAANVIAPHAEHVHRTNGDVPEEIVTGLAEIGAFGLSVPAEYGGYSEGGDDEYTAMVVATEELSRASLGIGGSLITRPEILTRALVKGGTEAQKLHWLPKLATAEVMPAVAVTEPDYGSDVAGIKVTATRRGPRRRARLRDQRRQDVVHVRCPRRRARPARPHRPRPLEGAPRPQPVHRAQGARRRPRLRVHPGSRRSTAARVGKMEGRPIDTIGYRGMHSYEIALEDWWVPADHLVGEADGLGRGFYYQMEGFENGRLQTAPAPSA